MNRTKQKPLKGIGAVAPSELVELAGSVRAVVDRMLRIDGANEALVRARERLDVVARELEPHAHPEGPPRLGSGHGAEAARPYYVDGVMPSRHHPQAPDFHIATQDDVTRGSVRFGVVFEGPPGCVHGGHVACFFDQILGHHNLELGLPAMTVSLCVHYRKPTPLFTRLEFEARLERTEGRKVVTLGTLRDGDRVYAEGEGIFVLPDTKRSDFLSESRK